LRSSATAKGSPTSSRPFAKAAALYGPNLYTGDFDDMRRFHGFFPIVKLFGSRPHA
jgi:hypothetical protein